MVYDIDTIAPYVALNVWWRVSWWEFLIKIKHRF
jgi:hypothetical protein